MEYTLYLVGEKVKRQQVTALHLISALAFLGAGAIIFTYNNSITYWGLALVLMALLMLVVTIGMNKWVTKPLNNKIFRVVELAMAAGLFAYSVMQLWKVPMGIFGVLSLALLFSLFWERPSNAAQSVVADEKGMVLSTGIRNRVFEWTGIDEVLFRFGVLSIGTTDNHRFQWNVQKVPFDADEFERFCNEMIEKNKPLRGKNNW